MTGNLFMPMLGSMKPLLVLDGNDANGGGSTGGQNFEQLYKTAQQEIANLQSTLEKERSTFQERLGGLQGSLQSEKDQHKKTADSLKELQTNFDTLQGQVASLEGEKKILTDNLEKVNADYGKTKFELERKNVIFKEYPGLAEFEGKGLLPGVEKIEDAANVYKLFAETIGAVKEQAKTEYGSGSSPQMPVGKQNSEINSASLLSEAKKLAASGDEKGYNAKMEEYRNALAKEKPST